MESDNDSNASSLWLSTDSSLSFESESDMESDITSLWDVSSEPGIAENLAGAEDDEDENSSKTDTLADYVGCNSRKPLYDGAKLSTFDSYLLVMNYALRHSLTKQAVGDLLDLVDMHLPASSMVSLYKLRKFFLNLFEDISFKRRHCCSICHSLLTGCDEPCPNRCCGTAMEFLTVSVEAQLKRKFQGMYTVYECCTNDCLYCAHCTCLFQTLCSGGISRKGLIIVKKEEFVTCMMEWNTRGTRSSFQSQGTSPSYLTQMGSVCSSHQPSHSGPFGW